MSMYIKDGRLHIVSGPGFKAAWDQLMKGAWDALPQNRQQQTTDNMHSQTSDAAELLGAKDAHNNEQIRVITQIAEMCHWANRSWCHMNGDDSQPKWADAPDWMKESAIQGIKFLLANPRATPEDQHEAWCSHKHADGWKLGATKDPNKKEHPCLVTYKELPLEQQVKDSIYQGVAKGMIAKYIETGQLAISRPLTDGEDVMNIQFNLGGSPLVNRIKRAFADLHDLCVKEAEQHQGLILNREGLSTAEARTSKKANQCGRLMAVALTNIEQAQMWAVKAVTR